MKKGIDGGAAGAIAKSLFGESGKLGRNFPRPRFKLFDYKDYPGYPDVLPHAFTLHSLEECSHFGYEEYMEDINAAKDMVGDDGVIMASLSGATMEVWEIMCKMVNETKADWVELNVSCPFAADMGVKMGAGAVELCTEITRLCAGILKKPFSVKISPQAADPVAIAEEVEKAGAMAVNLSARLSGIMIDIETAKPIGPGAMGGWGGPYLLGYGLKIVSQAAKRLHIPIIAGLGVWDWQDIIRYVMVGASLVQSGAGIMLQGYNISKKWVDSINMWLDNKGYNSLDEIRGIALPNILRTRDIERAPEGVHAVVDFKKCNRCGTCTRSCFYDAITLTKAGAIVNTNKCDGCGMCMEVCPQNAVTMSKGKK
ncbi:NAD-dependent dihydropyrimidine dehydrogenase subunit PreA [Moorella stamsii]|uniref:dihydrouracil dehydrogenase (NAD(+)) n=2 Tax=Neomoorella stamsii TaxID=1266720 RepID=A0A9X7J0Q8_9FIRM|nr:NAD-dependent dihydropyrimidine dehydrogenase subunit PreA [Moorella stamsii]